MKIIRNGVKYDTDTSIYLAQEPLAKKYLHLSVSGDFFFAVYGPGKRETIKPTNVQTAKRFLGRFAAHVYEDIFGKVEEIPAGIYKDKFYKDKKDIKFNNNIEYWRIK